MKLWAVACCAVVLAAGVEASGAAATKRGRFTPGGAASRPVVVPDTTPAQAEAIGVLQAKVALLMDTAAEARTGLLLATASDRPDIPAINSAGDKLAAADLALAIARADGISRMQSGPEPLNPMQLRALIALLDPPLPAATQSVGTWSTTLATPLLPNLKLGK